MSPDQIERLERLAALRVRGVLTEAEFQQQKAAVLAGPRNFRVPTTPPVIAPPRVFDRETRGIAKPSTRWGVKSALGVGIAVLCLLVCAGFFGSPNVRTRQPDSGEGNWNSEHARLMQAVNGPGNIMDIPPGSDETRSLSIFGTPYSERDESTRTDTWHSYWWAGNGHLLIANFHNGQCYSTTFFDASEVDSGKLRH